ncbi:MAG: restriction endonuclease subunit S [Ignavibacteria bacterium]|jgi:type I restriction enzyme M protein|nr:restriction endonuclease subunit S [Ignavibacteria bacterium]MDH7528994.1 restriction endonuclease subunit S [Ignavibacteria bacterium]
MGVIRTLNNEILNSKYLFLNLKNSKFNEYLRIQISGVNINNLNSKILYEFQISLPPLEVQLLIVDKIESERKVIDSLREMVKTYEEKIKKVIDRVWGEE